MNKAAVIITKIETIAKLIVENVVDLVFAPVWFVFNIVKGIIDIIGTEMVAETEETVENTVEYPKPAHIKGFQTNQSEVDQIQEIKRQLNGE